MPIDSDLHAAGERAAAHPVPPAPSIAILEAAAAKHTSRRRIILSGATLVILAALAFPLALTMRGSTTVQTVAAGTGQPAAPQAAPAQTAPTQGDPAEPESSDPVPAQSDEGIHIQLRSGSDFSVAIRVLSGDAATPAAEAAEAVATETLDIDGMTIWIAGSGDERTVSALVEPDEFVEVTGNAEQLDMLIEVLRNGGLAHHGAGRGLHGFNFFDDGEFSIDIDGVDLDGLDDLLNGLDRDFGDFSHFEDLEEFFGPDGFNFNFDENFDFDGDGFTFNFDLDEFDPDAFDFDGNFSFDGDFGNLERFFGPDGFDFDSEFFGQNFDGCIVIDHTESGTDTPFHLEFPTGCGSAD